MSDLFEALTGFASVDFKKLADAYRETIPKYEKWLVIMRAHPDVFKSEDADLVERFINGEMTLAAEMPRVNISITNSLCEYERLRDAQPPKGKLS